MARMPGTTWVGERSPKREMDRHDGVCVHTIVGYAPAHAAHFSVKADGTILQSRDTRYQSGANKDGNHRIIAIENEDTGPRFGRWPAPDNAPPLTPEQVEANARILAWAHETHDVPLQLMPNSRPTSRGLAYHRQGIDGNFSGYDYPGRVSGGEVWTDSYGKVCPTDNRIAQRPAILARAKQIVAGSPTTDPEDDMTPEQAAQLEQVHNYVVERGYLDLKVSGVRDAVLKDTKTILTAVQQVGVGGLNTRDVLVARVASLSAAVGALAVGKGADPAVIQQACQDGAEAALREVLGGLDQS